MSVNINQVPFLREQRQFPQTAQALTIEVDRAYIDIANAVNARTIGLYGTSGSTVTGESWYITSQRQQGQRRVYPFTAAGNIPHGLNFASIAAFVKIYGTFTDGTNWYPLPYVDVTAANNQVNVYVSPTNIVITVGGGSPPAITQGYVVLEWIV